MYELALRTGLFRRLSACFRDHRDPQRTRHPVEVLVAAHVLGLALGYEDLIDHDTLGQSKLWSLLCGAAGLGLDAGLGAEQFVGLGQGFEGIAGEGEVLQVGHRWRGSRWSPAIPCCTPIPLTSLASSAIVMPPSSEQPHLSHSQPSTIP